MRQAQVSVFRKTVERGRFTRSGAVSDDLVVVPARTAAEAVVTRPDRELVLKDGEIVARDGRIV